MWDSFIIFLSKNPFWVSFPPVILAIIFLFFGRKILKYKLLGIVFLIAGICIGSVLHFRWDSYSIHFCKIDSDNFTKDKILFIGDSITAEGTRPKGFITKIESILQVETSVICSKGATSDQIISLFNSFPHDLQFSHIIAQSGINDLICGLSANETAKAQNRLLKIIHSTYPKSIVIFIPVHPFFKEKQFFNLSTYPFSKTNILPCWGNPVSFSENYLVKDGIHLNAKGHTLLCKNLIQKLTENI